MKTTIRLGDILEEFTEHRPDGDEPEVLTLTERNGFVSQASRFHKRLAIEDTKNYKHIRRGDIAYNPYLLWAGAIAQNKNWDSAIISPLYPTFRVKEGYDSTFAIHLLSTEQLIKRYDQISFGSVPRRRRASVRDFLNLEVPSPPTINKQQWIAEVLDRASELRVKRRRAITLLDDLARSIFLDMFGDSGSNPHRWDIGVLDDVIDRGPQNGLYKPSSKYGSGVPIVRIDAFHGGSIKKLDSLKRLQVSSAELKTWGLQEGDVLINRVNSLKHLGKSAYVPKLVEPTVYESNMMRFSVNKSILSPQFLVQMLQTADIKNQILRRAKNAVNQSSINQGDVRALRIFIPPLEMQQEYVRRLKLIGIVKLTSHKQLPTLDELFASLQGRAFRGEL
ncbi:restriction endonuclease subunit S [Actinomadura coerulea]|uniref:restriction endonuclease subunit S n=1 Tax=Actinomadura coerulea TaxID=46159 RepID=UPI003430371E